MSYLHLNIRSEHKKGESTMLSICVVHPSSTDPEIIAMDTGNHRSSGKNRNPGKKNKKKKHDLQYRRENVDISRRRERGGEPWVAHSLFFR